MKIKLAEGKDVVSESLEFYLVGLDQYEDFDLVIKVLEEKMEIKIYEKTDGIYSRIGKYKIDGLECKLIYHDDVGVYSFSMIQSVVVNQRLKKIFQDLVFLLNSGEINKK